MRDGLFQWFIDIRHSLKGRLPRKFLVLKAKELYQEYLKQNPDIPELPSVVHSTSYQGLPNIMYVETPILFTDASRLPLELLNLFKSGVK